MTNVNIAMPATGYNAAEAFWRNRLSLVKANQTVAANEHFAGVEKRSFLSEEIKLSQGFQNWLSEIADDPLTTFGIVTSIFSLLFYRYYSSSPVVFAVPYLEGERDNCDNDNADLGVFPLILQQGGDDSLKDFLGGCMRVMEDCYSYTDGLNELAEREDGWNATAFSNILISSRQLHISPQNEIQFDIRINIDTDLGTIFFEYNPEVFPRYRAELIEGHLEQIATACHNIDMPVSEIEILTEEERRQLLGLNPAMTNKDDRRTVVDIFREVVSVFPDRTAIRFEEKAIAYKELDLVSSRLAMYLRQELGAQPNSTIAVMMDRSDLLIVAILGILKSGACYVPIDPGYPKERIEYLLNTSESQILITESAFLFEVPFYSGSLFAIDIQLDSLPEVADDTNVPIDDQSPAYMIFTSGSTGKPKGVEICHASVFNYLNWAKEFYFTHNPDGGSFPLFTSISFDLTITSVFVPLLKGQTIEIYAEQEAGEILKDIFGKSGSADTVKLTPSHIAMLADVPAGTTNVRSLIVGGEALREDHISIVKVKWPGMVIFNEYGPTEATVGCTVAEVNVENISIGRPIANVSIYVLDENRRLLPFGAAGEIYIGGSCLALGYFRQPEQTRSAFIDSPFVNGEKIYRTGDIGLWLQDGNLQYLGRKDSQVKIRGYRIETGEIESRMLEISGVKDAAVVVCVNNTNNASLAAFYTVASEVLLDVGEVRTILMQKIPGYMIPTQITLLEEMPLTPNFKIDRQRLAKMDLSEGIGTEYIAPVSEMEADLVRVFRDVLGREKVGILDNFFAIGGDSIIGIQIVSRANMQGIKITLKQLFNEGTISGLASVAERVNPVIKDQSGVFGNIDLTPIHQWFFEQRFENPSHYNQSIVINVPPGFNPIFAEAAMSRIVEHHDMLRMRVKRNDEKYVEYIPIENFGSPFTVRDFRSIAQPELDARLLEDIDQVQASLDIFAGPMLSVRYYDLGAGGQSLLVLVAHHLVVDGVSWRILLEDLITGYIQASSGQAIIFPEKTSSFRDWAVSALSYSASAELAHELPIWTNESWFDARPLPVDMACNIVDNKVKNSLVHAEYLDEFTTTALISGAHAAYNTRINDLLLTGLLVAFSNYTESENILIAMEGHGREEVFEHIDLTRTIGWFTAVYPVLLKLDNADGLRSVIRSVKEQLRAIPNNGVGYGLLRYGNATDDVKQALGRLPQPEVIFNYLGQSGQALPSDSGWSISSFQPGKERDEESRRDYFIEVNAIVIDGLLNIHWTYCPLIFNEETIKKLAGDYGSSLRELVTHCLDHESGGFSPSDFPEAGLEQGQLDFLISQIKLQS